MGSIYTHRYLSSKWERTVDVWVWERCDVWRTEVRFIAYNVFDMTLVYIYAR
jgi:hypothetical protein